MGSLQCEGACTRSSVCDRKCDLWSELWGARSRLYRSRFLQLNTRWKALAEIYTMHSFAPFSNLKIFVKNCCFFSAFFPKIRKFCQNFAEFSPHVTNFFRDFSKMQHFSKIFKMCNIFLGIFSKICRFFRKKAEFSGHETAKKVIVWITYRTSCNTYDF